MVRISCSTNGASCGVIRHSRFVPESTSWLVSEIELESVLKSTVVLE